MTFKVRTEQYILTFYSLHKVAHTTNVMKCVCKVLKWVFIVLIKI